MGKIFEQKINNFSGGLSEDKRIQVANKYSVTKHFDAFSFPHKLVPRFKTVDNNGTLPNRTKTITRFLYAPYLSAGAFRLYGYGVVTGTTKPAVYMLDVDSGSALSTLDWTAPAGNESGTAGRNLNVFFYYKNYIYMWDAGTGLVRFDTTAVQAFNDIYFPVAYTNVIQPVHHPSDDIAYFFHDNIILKIDNTTLTDNVLVLPTNLKITSACAYGNYLAIGCVTLGTANQKSIVYLWDRDSSLTTLTERIDFGEGNIQHLFVLDNKLMVIMGYYLNSNLAGTKSKILVKERSGLFSTTLNELLVESNAVTVFTSTNSVIKDNKIYFAAEATLNGDSRLGVWVVDSSGRMTMDFQEENANGSYSGIYNTGNIWWIAYGGNGSISYTSDSQVFSTTLSSVYESLIFNGGDQSKVWKLISVIVSTEPLPTAGQIVLKYRKNEETAWTTIFTSGVDNSISHEAINIESSGATLPQFNEISFQINSTGGAAVTGLSFKYEEISSGLSN